MEIKIKAVRQKLDYAKTDSTLGSFKEESKERFFPLFELMMRTIKNNQEQNTKEGKGD